MFGFDDAAPEMPHFDRRDPREGFDLDDEARYLAEREHYGREFDNDDFRDSLGFMMDT